MSPGPAHSTALYSQSVSKVGNGGKWPQMGCFIKFRKTENAYNSASRENLTTVFVLEDFSNHTGPDLKE